MIKRKGILNLKKLSLGNNNNIEKWYLGYLCQGILVLGTIPILLPIIVEHYTDDAIADIIAAMFYTGQLTAPFWGKIADSTRNLGLFYLLGYIMLGIGTFFFSFLQNEAFWLLLALLQGMGTESTNTVAAMFIVEFKPKKEWNIRIGWLQCFYGIGQASGLSQQF